MQKFDWNCIYSYNTTLPQKLENLFFEDLQQNSQFLLVRQSVSPSVRPSVRYAFSDIEQMTHRVARLGLFCGWRETFTILL